MPFTVSCMHLCLSLKPQYVDFIVYICIRSLTTMHKASRQDHESFLERCACYSMGNDTILNQFQDIDTIDNMLGGTYPICLIIYLQSPHTHSVDALRMMAATSSSIIGAVILISIVLPWFLIAVACILVLYIYAASFYRASARELKVCSLLLSIF